MNGVESYTDVCNASNLIIYNHDGFISTHPDF